MKPFLFLTFANNEKKPLPKLQEESDLLMQALAPLAKAERVQIHPDNFATIDKVANYLTLYKDQILLFHYAGHANSQHLILTDQAAKAGGIAQLLAQQNNLQLVFLNGCSTKGQVQVLLDLDIPIVIATSAPIKDRLAMDFANSFYKAIANDHSINSAFNIAAGLVEAKTGSVPEVYRDTGLRAGEELEAAPWGLYTKKESTFLEQTLIPPKSNSTMATTTNKSKVEGNGNIVLQDIQSTSGPIHINITNNQNAPSMDVLTKSVPFILEALSKQESSDFKEWIQPILWKEPIVKSMLEGSSPKEFKQEFLKNHVATLLEEETFKTTLTQWINKLDATTTEKNIVKDSEVDVKGDITIGDKTPQTDKGLSLIHI